MDYVCHCKLKEPNAQFGSVVYRNQSDLIAVIEAIEGACVAYDALEPIGIARPVHAHKWSDYSAFVILSEDGMEMAGMIAE